MPVQFYLDPRTNKSGESSIRAAFCCRGEKLITTIGLTIAPKVWADWTRMADGYVNSRGYSGDEISRIMGLLRDKMTYFEHHCRHRPSKEELHKAVMSMLERWDSIDKRVLPYVDMFICEQSAICQWADGTVSVLRSFRNHIASFDKNLRFDYFDAGGIGKWIISLRSKGLEESSVRKLYQHLKWFLLWAVRNGYTDKDDIRNYRPKFKIVEKPVVFLSADELMHLYNYRVPADGSVPHPRALETVRDGFCLCAFTSLRYSDLAKLKKTDISDDMLWITTQKTHDRLPIDLNTQAKTILAKYSKSRLPGGRAIPVLSNQKMNLYLKELCRLCDISSPVTKVFYKGGCRIERTCPKYEVIGTHAARRTFICFALESGIPPQVVMKWTGHSDYKSMKPYIEITGKAKSAAMQRISDNWSRLEQGG